MALALQSLRFARVLTLAGIALAALGALPWIVLLAGARGADQPVLLALAAVAVLGGAFVALVGVGLGRTLRAARRAADERRVDAAVLAAAAGADPNCGHSCTTCTTSCSLQDLRTSPTSG